MFSTVAPRMNAQHAGQQPNTVQRVIFAMPETLHLANIAETLRSQRVRVCFVDGIEAAYLKAVGESDIAVIIPVRPEAGLLVPAKIANSLPNARIVLMAPREDERVKQFAEFMDAHITYESDSADSVAKAIANW